MIRIRDVAKRLNLSITTVSRALDGYDDVAEDTRQMVIQVAQEMGYTPNRAARQLRRQRAEAIGYILPSDAPRFADPYISEFIAGLGDETAVHNYDLLVSVAPPDATEEQFAYQRWIQGGKIDGIVISHVRLHDWRIQYLDKQQFPYVCVERSVDPVTFYGVEVDSYSGLLELMAHLISMGHRQIAYIGCSFQLKVDYDRFAGYKAGLVYAGITPDPELVVHGNLTPEGGYLAAERLFGLAAPPTAIVCVNDSTAIGAMHAAHNRGIAVGRDVAVTGFDGIADSAHTQPPLTTLEQPVYDVARQLVKLLLARIMDEDVPECQVKIQPKLTIRASTGGKGCQ